MAIKLAAERVRRDYKARVAQHVAARRQAWRDWAKESAEGGAAAAHKLAKRHEGEQQEQEPPPPEEDGNEGEQGVNEGGEDEPEMIASSQATTIEARMPEGGHSEVPLSQD